MTGFDPAAFPMARKGRQYQDFTVGQVLEHHWGRTITAGDNALFTTAMCNWNPMYVNAEFARAHGHADVVVNPMLVLCTVVGLSVEDLSEAGGPFLGVDELTFHRAVYPGDVVEIEGRVKRLRSRMGTLDGRASVNGRIVANGSMTFALGPSPHQRR